MEKPGAKLGANKFMKIMGIFNLERFQTCKNDAFVFLFFIPGFRE
jgi:hypothetical protein